MKKIYKLLFYGRAPYYWVVILCLAVYSISFIGNLQGGPAASYIKDGIADFPFITSHSTLPGNESNVQFNPLLDLTYHIDLAVWNAQYGLIITNILLHIINSLLLMRLIKKLGYDKKNALYAAILFIIHPIFSITISYPAHRSELLAASFILLGLITLINYMRKNQTWRFALHTVIVLLAFLSNEATLALLVFFPIFVTVITRRSLISFQKGNMPNVALMLGWAGSFAVWFILREIWLPGSMIISVESIIKGLFNNFAAYLFYFNKIFFPFGLDETILYPGPAIIYGIISFAILAFLLFISEELRMPYVFFGFLWFIVLLAPAVILSKNDNFELAKLYTALPGIIILLLENNVFSERLVFRPLKIPGLIIAYSIFVIINIANQVEILW